MARQNINVGASANDGTGDTLRIAGQKINANFIELYSQAGDSNAVSDFISLSSSGIIYNHATYTTTFSAAQGTSDVTYTFPNETGTVTFNAATQTLTNKTLTSPVLTTPQINNTGASFQYVFTPSNIAADRNVTLPLLASNDEFTFNNHTQTLLNKRLDSADIRNPEITGWIADNTSAPIIRLDPNANAVNHVKINNASTTNLPQIAAYSENTPNDSDVSLGIISQNFGLVDIRSGLRYRPFQLGVAGNIDPRRALTVLNPAVNVAVGLIDPPQNEIGQTIKIVNKGAGDAVITPTSFAPGTSFTVRQNGMTEVMWDGAEWQLNEAFHYDSAGTGAKVYVTA